MKLSLSNLTHLRQKAFTLAEVLIGVAIMGVAFISLYAGMSGGFAVTQLGRENLRATQILLERMEGIRLYNWEQLNTNSGVFPPATFTKYYYPLATNGESQGIAYQGTLLITNANLTPTATYGNNIRKVVVTVTWESGGVQRSRSMTTYASRNGLQNYVYSN
jgi:prepilin-type N-terminal cleavage/methylation domain-containing protein